MPSPRIVEGDLYKFNLTLYTGRITAGKTRFQLGDNSALNLNNVKFDGTNKRTILSGKLSGALGLGSVLTVTENPAQTSFLRFGNIGSADLFGLNVTIIENQSPTIKIDGGKLRFSVLRGELYFNGQNSVAFENGEVDLDLSQSIWGGVAPPTVAGHINLLKGLVVGGRLTPNTTSILKLKGGELETSNLDFDSRKTSFPISGDFTKAKLMLDKGSIIEMPNKFRVETDRDASLTAATPTKPLYFRENNSIPEGEIAAHLPIKRGLANLSQGNLELRGGTADLQIVSTPGQPFAKFISLKEIRTGTGTLKLNEVTTLKTTSGSFSADRLVVTKDVGLIGEFQVFEMTFAPSMFGVPDGIIAETKDGGTFSASDENGYFTLPENGGFPLGRFKFAFDFKKLSNIQNGRFEISNGRVNMPRFVSSASGLDASDGSINGLLQVKSPEMPGTPAMTFMLPFLLTNTTITKQAGSASQLGGNWSVTLPRGIVIPFTVPGGDDSDSGIRFFDIETIFTFRQDFTVAGRIEFNGNRITIPETSSTAVGSFEVKSGNGEHEDQAFETTNGKKAPSQEFATKFVPAPGACRFHLYLKPRSYDTNMKIAVSFDDEGLKVGIADFHTDTEAIEDDGWERDGCGGIVQGLLCSAILTPIMGPASVAICAGGVIGANLYVNGRINDKIREKTGGFKKQWTILRQSDVAKKSNSLRQEKSANSLLLRNYLKSPKKKVF